MDQWLIDTTLNVYPHFADIVGKQWLRETPFHIDWREMEVQLRECLNQVENGKMSHADACVIFGAVLDAYTRRGI